MSFFICIWHSLPIPTPAFLTHLHHAFDFILVNEGSTRIQHYFLDPAAVAGLGPANAMRLIFHPQAFRPYIVNWEATAASLIQWLHRDALNGAEGAETHHLLEELLADPDVPRHLADPGSGCVSCAVSGHSFPQV